MDEIARMLADSRAFESKWLFFLLRWMVPVLLGFLEVPVTQLTRFSRSTGLPHAQYSSASFRRLWKIRSDEMITRTGFVVQREPQLEGRTSQLINQWFPRQPTELLPIDAEWRKRAYAAVEILKSLEGYFCDVVKREREFLERLNFMSIPCKYFFGNVWEGVTRF